MTATRACPPTARTGPTIPAVLCDSHEIVAGSAGAGLILLCDHASNALPDGYASLGLPPCEFARHIAYDIGAADVVRHLASTLGVPAILSRYSRLLIDPNRGLDDPTLVMRISDGAVIPGNRTLDEAERERRIERYYRPYHRAISATIEAALSTTAPPILLSLHSFTPCWKGKARPWHAAVLWDEDARLSSRLLHALRREPGLVVGDNEPYSGKLHGDTMWQHGTSRGLAHAIVEIRQDLIETPAGQAEWAARLARIVCDIRADPATEAALRTRHTRATESTP